MDDPIVITIVMRFIERFIVVAGGCLAIYCGYRLFLAMPSAEKGTGKLELPGGVSIHVSRVGPGVFFSLFGAVILAFSYHYGVSVDNSGIAAAPAQQVAPAPGTAVASAEPRRTTFSGMAGTPSVEPDASTLVAVAIDIERLNRAAARLDPALDATTRSDIRRSLRAARVALMQANWSDAEWGDRATFVTWLAAGEPLPPPDAIGGAVEVYRAGL